MALNILVVDDSAVVRAVISKTLKLAGIPVGELYQAANGKEALEILNDNWVDLVFSDINMPVMGGVEMIEKMSADGLLKTIPVVVVSTEGSATRIEQLKSRGISAYIRKPFTPELVRKVVDDIIGRQDEE
ncbi:MAG TPA: response regulator [Candidatus Marinimicrobia bacterium]|nr:response regulator [Candidatus Neomarinimicrobiota bacterium]